MAQAEEIQPMKTPKSFRGFKAVLVYSFLGMLCQNNNTEAQTLLTSEGPGQRTSLPGESLSP